MTYTMAPEKADGLNSPKKKKKSDHLSEFIHAHISFYLLMGPSAPSPLKGMVKQLWGVDNFQLLHLI